MRIHGDKVIKRRSGLEQRSDYHEYLPELREDFKCMCGYCGKTERVTKNAFEIDHFVPKKYAKFRENDYSNLVYSCYVCNRKKSSKWPSEDAKIQFIEERGFIDPATEAFQFHLRPMKEVWQLMQLIEKKEKLREKMKVLMPDEIQDYIEMDELLEVLQGILFQSKE